MNSSISNKAGFSLGVKCAPDEAIFRAVEKSGITNIELYVSKEILDTKGSDIAKLCRRFPFRYAVHAARDDYAPQAFFALVEDIKAEIVVVHEYFYWEDEWKDFISLFKASHAQVCIENITTVDETMRFTRRYGIKKCLDLEHLQIECAGVYEEVYLPLIRSSTHIHMSGYFYGSNLWHTHIHHSPEHSAYFLDLIQSVGYSGLVISEAKVSLQTYDEFKQLHDFFTSWCDRRQIKDT